MNYDDFDLELGMAHGNRFPVAVRSTGGECRASFSLPFDAAELDLHLQELALLRSSDTLRQPSGPGELPARRFGGALFVALIQGDVRSAYDASRREAQRHGRGLRIRLRIQDAGLAALPWEFLYDRRVDAYLGLSGTTSIVRSHEVAQPPEPSRAPAASGSSAPSVGPTHAPHNPALPPSQVVQAARNQGVAAHNRRDYAQAIAMLGHRSALRPRRRCLTGRVG